MIEARHIGSVSSFVDIAIATSDIGHKSRIGHSLEFMCSLNTLCSDCNLIMSWLAVITQTMTTFAFVLFIVILQITVEHPAAKSMIEIARTQDEEVGDGTTSVIILGKKTVKIGSEIYMTLFMFG